MMKTILVLLLALIFPSSALAEDKPPDPIKKTQKTVNDFTVKLLLYMGKVAGLDTQARKDVAHKNLVEDFQNSFRDKRLTFKFVISNVALGSSTAKNAGTSSPQNSQATLRIGKPDGIKLPGRSDHASSYVLRSFAAPLSVAEATRIAQGDILVLSGEAELRVASGRSGADGADGTVNSADVLRIYSKVSKYEYTIRLLKPTYNVKKPSDFAEPSPAP